MLLDSYELRRNIGFGDPEWRPSDRLWVNLLGHWTTVLIVIAILLGGVGWDIDRLTLDQVEWALKV